MHPNNDQENYLYHVKRKILLPTIILSIVLGWSLGYIRVPYLEDDVSFWVGVIGGACLISLAVLLVGKKSTQNKIAALSWRRVVLLFAVVVSLGINFVFYQNQQLKRTEQMSDSKELQSKLDSLHQQNTYVLLKEVLLHIEEDVEEGDNRSLAVHIQQLSGINRQLKPYEFSQSDGLELSPERGQMLLFLLALPFDTLALNTLYDNVSFAYADLKGANFASQHLSGIDLSYSRLTDAQLQDANLAYANLQFAATERCNLTNANLYKSNLRRAKMEWAKLSGAILTNSKLSGVKLVNAKIQNANLNGSSIERADLSNAKISNSNLSYCDFTGTNLSRSDLSNASLDSSNLLAVNFSDTKLNNTIVDSNWLTMLDEWRIRNASEIKENYLVVRDSLSTDSLKPFVLIPVKR